MFGKGNKEELAAAPNNKELCVIAHGTTIEGDINIMGNMRLDGVIKGNINSQGRVVMSAQAVITGNIVCLHIDTSGKIDGNITVSEKAHLRATAKIKGTIKYKKIQIEEGAIMNGQLISANNAPQNQAKKNTK